MSEAKFFFANEKSFILGAFALVISSYSVVSLIITF